MAMDAKLKAKWLRMLRSRKYRQARLTLFVHGNRALKKKPRYCCIAVGGVAAGLEDQLDMLKTWGVARKLGLSRQESDHLVTMNDQYKKGFAAIASWISRNISVRKPRKKKS